MANTLAPEEGEVTKLTLDEGYTLKNRAAETMPSTLPLVIRCLSRSSLDKLSIPSKAGDELARYFKALPSDYNYR